MEPSAGTKKRWKGKKQLAIFNDDGVRLASSTDDPARTPCPDWWDISIINPNAKERLGYPTQKPLSLLERIVSASSNQGDVVLDPFCGCGTAVEAAEKLGRNWIGIDIAHYAVTLIEERLTRWRPNARYEVFGRPTEMAGARELARRDKHQFQWWAAWLLGAQSYRGEQRGPDGGIDGRIVYRNGPYGDGHIIISVKGGENIGVAMVRELRGTIEDDNAEMGILVTLAEPTNPMVTAAAGAGFVRRSAHGRMPRIQIVTIAELLAGQLPKLPPLPLPERNVPSAKKRTSRDQLELLLPVSGDATPEIRGDFIDPRFMAFGKRKRTK